VVTSVKVPPKTPVVNIQIHIAFSDADQAAYAALSPDDQQTFIVCKLAAQQAPSLMASLAHGNIMAMLSLTDQQAISGLIAAVKASA
jgi:hypothetical protein